MPSPADPLVLLAFEQRAYGLAEGFEPIELAPLSPLGTPSPALAHAMFSRRTRANYGIPGISARRGRPKRSPRMT